MPISRVLSSEQLPAPIPVTCPVRLESGGLGVLIARHHGRRQPCEVLTGGEHVFVREDDICLDVSEPGELAKSLGHPVIDALPVLVEMLGRAMMGMPKTTGPKIPVHYLDGGGVMPQVRYHYGLDDLEFWVLQFLGYAWCFHHEPKVLVHELGDLDYAIHVPALAEVSRDVPPDVRSAAVAITVAKPWEASP